MKKLRIFCLGSILLFCSLNVFADQIIYETYTGECVGECSSTLKLDAKSKQMCFLDYQKEKPRCIEKKWTKIEFIKLLKQTPAEFYTLPAVVGEPDSYDQGGIRLEIISSDKRNKSNIDQDQIPPKMKSFLEKLNRISKEFK